MLSGTEVLAHPLLFKCQSVEIKVVPFPSNSDLYDADGDQEIKAKL